MEASTAFQGQGIPKYLKLAVVLFSALLLQACSLVDDADEVAVSLDSVVVEEQAPGVGSAIGEDEDPVPEPTEDEDPVPEPTEDEDPVPEPTEDEDPVPEPTEDEDPVPEPTIEELLLDTDWEVVDMIGFPPDNTVDGTFRFREDQNGVSPARFWFEDGINGGSGPIAWTDTGFVKTDAAVSTDVGGDPRYLDQILGPVESSITATLEGETLTLTRDELTVVAEQR